MAANRAVVTVSASLLPDDIKTSISGTTVYDLNDIGNTNGWLYYANTVGTSAGPIMSDGLSYIGGAPSGDENDVLDADVDDLGFLVIKHSGYRGDGTTVSTDKLYLNIAHGVDAAPAAGALILEAGEVWWGRFYHSDIADISLEASANDIKALIWAVTDDGGV